MTDDFLEIQLDYTAKCKPVPCPNCKAKLDRKPVMNENSPNVGRPFVTCETCSSNGKICFWFLDHGECDHCGCPLYRGPAKKRQECRSNVRGLLARVCGNVSLADIN